jgi:hypothetical protein
LALPVKKNFTYSEKSEEKREEYLRAIGQITAYMLMKVEDSKRGRKFYRVNVVAGQIHDEGGVRRLAPMCYQGTMKGYRFVEKGKTVIMDRASFHRKKQLEEACKKHGVYLQYLPPYSPDYNPIEKTWANMNKELQNTAPLHGLIETAVYAYLT